MNVIYENENTFCKYANKVRNHIIVFYMANKYLQFCSLFGTASGIVSGDIPETRRKINVMFYKITP